MNQFANIYFMHSISNQSIKHIILYLMNHKESLNLTVDCEDEKIVFNKNKIQSNNLINLSIFCQFHSRSLASYNMKIIINLSRSAEWMWDENNRNWDVYVINNNLVKDIECRLSHTVKYLSFSHPQHSTAHVCIFENEKNKNIAQKKNVRRENEKGKWNKIVHW